MIDIQNALTVVVMNDRWRTDVLSVSLGVMKLCLSMLSIVNL